LADDQAEDEEELAFLRDRKRSDGFLFGSGKSDPPKLVYPVEGRISSHYGARRKKLHKGIDIAAYIGTPIVAAGDGEVIFSGRRRGYGSTVVIDHGQFMTLYAHASKLIARRGDRVRQGDFIAKVGRTGNARGVHLHFEIRDSENRPLDPEKYLFANNIAQSNSQSNIRSNSQLSQPVGSPKLANGQAAVLPKTKRKTKSKSKPKINLSHSKQRKGKKGLLYAKD
jgi:murein DD-endopeptidase MepM/ murein hydrolase activator NlpD